MIIDSQTNIVYLSSLLPDRYPEFWKDLETILNNHSIKYKWIKQTHDIWCRDYMPVQLTVDEYVQFKFFPDYFLDYDNIFFLTHQYELDYTEFGSSRFIDLIVDGGNIVKSVNKAIMTEKVFRENKNRERKTVIKTLKKALRIEELIFIPIQPQDITGHADGMVRFYNENTVLVNEFTESASWIDKLNRAILKAGLEIICFPYQESTRKENMEYTAHGCYINFAQIGKLIIFPQFGGEFSKSDEDALNKIKELYPSPEYQVEPIDADQIAYNGGVINCCTWNISRPIIENAIDNIIPVYKLGDEILVIHKDDYQGKSIGDTLCVNLFLKRGEHSSPISLQKFLKFVGELIPINSLIEIEEIKQKITSRFSKEDISEIYSKLINPSDQLISELVSIPERLKK
jgi:agmatine deiminase